MTTLADGEAAVSLGWGTPGSGSDRTIRGSVGERVHRLGGAAGPGWPLSGRAHLSVVTGLLSLSSLEARLAAQPEPCGVVFVDLDGMKDVNDRHGHEVGDRLLQRAAVRFEDGVCWAYRTQATSPSPSDQEPSEG